MSQNPSKVIAGDCSVIFTNGDATHRKRGSVLVVVKPDNTVLVHDKAGYRPAAWLTRAETVEWTNSIEGRILEASQGEKQLRVTCHAEFGNTQYSVSAAGEPVGNCPGCTGPLIYGRNEVTCLGCDAYYSVPRDATVSGNVSERCSECELPTMRVLRGEEFSVCIDRECEPLDEAVRASFDEAWSCPACGGALRILRRGGLIAGCSNYPECDTGFAIPVGTIHGACDSCSLPVFDTASGARCLDSSCAFA